MYRGNNLAQLHQNEVNKCEYRLHVSLCQLAALGVLEQSIRPLHNGKNNKFEVLEFYGDSVLQERVTRFLVATRPFLSPHLLSQHRQASITNANLAIIYSKLKFNVFADVKPPFKDKQRADVVEAVIGELAEKVNNNGLSSQILAFTRNVLDDLLSYISYIGEQGFFTMGSTGATSIPVSSSTPQFFTPSSAYTHTASAFNNNKLSIHSNDLEINTNQPKEHSTNMNARSSSAYNGTNNRFASRRGGSYYNNNNNGGHRHNIAFTASRRSNLDGNSQTEAPKPISPEQSVNKRPPHLPTNLMHPPRGQLSEQAQTSIQQATRQHPQTTTTIQQTTTTTTKPVTAPRILSASTNKMPLKITKTINKSPPTDEEKDAPPKMLTLREVEAEHNTSSVSASKPSDTITSSRATPTISSTFAIGSPITRLLLPSDFKPLAIV